MFTDEIGRLRYRCMPTIWPILLQRMLNKVIMILMGRQQSDEDEKLTLIKMKKLIDMLRKPSSENLDVIRGIRKVNRFDSNVTEELSFKLPYFVMEQLSPKRLKNGHLVYIQHFCLDIHVFPQETKELELWKEGLKSDRNVEAIFLSAKGDVYHLLFCFMIPCKKEKEFRLFYREFAQDFYSRHGICDDVKSKECNPRRKILISHDPEARPPSVWRII